MDLTDFLLARIAEDEDGRARYLRDFAEALRAQRFTVADYLDEESARVLAECDAKRRIVEHHRSNGDDWPLCAICTEVGPDAQGWPCLTLRLLALPHADHQQFQEEWRP